MVVYEKTIRYLLEFRGWKNALVVEECVYPNLVKVFYSNMDAFALNENRVITIVHGIVIEFDMLDHNEILVTSDDGLEIYTSRKELHFAGYLHTNAIRNICRRSYLTDEFCSVSLHS